MFTPCLKFFKWKKNGHLRFFHQLVEGISQIIFQQKWKYFIEGFSRKIAKSKMAAIFTTPCIENLDWKDIIVIFENISIQNENLWHILLVSARITTYFSIIALKRKQEWTTAFLYEKQRKKRKILKIVKFCIQFHQISRKHNFFVWKLIRRY